MNIKRLLLILLPVVAVSAVVGGGYATWVFQANGKVEQKQDFNEVKVENVAGNFQRLYVWFGNDDFATAFPKASKTDTDEKTVNQPTLAADQSSVTFTSPLKTRAYLDDNLDTTGINFSLTYTLTTNDIFDTYFALFSSHESSSTEADQADSLTIKGAINTDTNGDKYVEFEDLNIEIDYLPAAAPLNEKALGNIVGAMNGSNSPLLTIDLVANASK